MFGPALLLLALVAGAMSLVTAYLLAWAAEVRTPVAAGVVLFLLAMMVAMFAGSFLYFARPSAGSLVAAFWLAGGVMSASVFPLFGVVLGEARRQAAEGAAYRPRGIERPRAFAAAVIALVLGNELLMGGSFQLASGTAWSALSGGGPAAFATNLVDSPWFLFTMAAEMAVTAYWLRDRLGRPLATLLGTQALIMLLSPPALPGPVWPVAASALGSAAMIGLIVYLLERIYREREIPAPFAGYAVRLLALYALMMAGLYLWIAYGSALAFAISVVVEMVLVFDAVVRPDRFREGERVAWALRPGWVFELLLAIFVAEIFMGALLDATLIGPAFAAGVPNLPLAGGPAAIASAALYNGFWFLAATTASTWFVLMMGVEMGALVLFKLLETRDRGLRARLALLIGAYAAFTVFFPGFWSSLPGAGQVPIARVPVIGWTMGIGTSGPLAPSFFVALLLSYVVLAVVSFLFGRRALCSVFCNAPLMYQGTFIDALKVYNRSSPIGRKFLSSRLGAVYGATTAIVLVSLAGASVASYLDSIGRLDLTLAGADPVVFLYSFYFGVLWYVMFVTIPYTGNYNCVTMGWCHWGTFSQAFGRIGFFRLKVKDRAVCRACTTLDCAKACPVGLVDMPGHFRTRGEFRSSKCCGVGDCISACPYGNMYIYDVRHAIAARLGLRSRPAAPARLPMVRAGPAPRGGAEPASAVPAAPAET
jgi:polyferredoxin